MRICQTEHFFDQPPGLRLRTKTARMATTRAASISPSTAPSEGPAAAGTGMVASGVGEGIGSGEGDGRGGVDGGEVGAVVTAVGAGVASSAGTARGVVTSVGLASVGTMLGVSEGDRAVAGVSTGGPVTPGVGERDGALVGVSTAGLVAMSVGEGRAVAAGTGVALASGVLVGLGVAVAAAVGGAAPLTTTWPPSTVTRWTLAAVFNTWTCRNPRVALPSPWAIQVIVAKTPVPLGPDPLPKLMAPKVTLLSALFTSGPMGTTERPVLPRKSPRAASVTCRMDES